EDAKPRRDDGPGRTAAREDGDLRLKARGVVERAGVDRQGLGLADLAAEHEAAADRAEIAHRIRAAGGFRGELPGLAADAHGAAGKPHEGDEPRTRRLLAIDTVAVAHEERLALGFIAQRAAKAAASVTFLSIGHS